MFANYIDRVGTAKPLESREVSFNKTSLFGNNEYKQHF